jgi:ABC-type lipoprotein export system ATPase subunit
LNIGEYARVSQGDLVIIAGEKNSGKTAFLMEVGLLNLHREKINYIVTENIRKLGERFLR